MTSLNTKVSRPEFDEVIALIEQASSIVVAHILLLTEMLLALD